MKKNDIVTGNVIDTVFPCTGKVAIEGTDRVASVKGVIPGQTVELRITRSSVDNTKGELRRIIKESDIESSSLCPHFCYPGEDGDRCGGCVYQTISYEDECRIKEHQIRKLFENTVPSFDQVFEGLTPSDSCTGYRNKMEYSFGNRVYGGGLEVGMHRKGAFYDIVSVPGCTICDPDFGLIIDSTRRYFKDTAFYRKGTHRGYLRHLLVRRAHFTGQILIDLVTADYLPESWSDDSKDSLRFSPFTDNRGGLTEEHPKMTSEEICDEKELLLGYVSVLRSLNLSGEIAGILHTRNNSLSDAVIDQGTEVLYGQDHFYEKLSGLSFKITPFSFFQTNSAGAEKLYEKAGRYLLEALGGRKPREVFDLYSGTGTITQIISPYADHVTGIEIVKEAVDAAKENAAANHITNCDFLCGDVFKVLDGIDEKPDYIIVDPPREGLSPKALRKILSYEVPSLIYIACQPASLARDIPAFLNEGYKVSHISCVDMFPRTAGVEVIALFTKK
ncbi:MAG: class I SAM-dependent RNA methyltransferase [Lachnospiraceae bacterium]|uniref:Class I SAM-dependent RNA methyltransferase n=1 Tax=Candidatus Weimeria bifida TaxID=2599074 RepID=A0A6N7J231_9FIRM|nr:class I SAM-dependent RNA methyltransferase [Candidatus Weimeria bifida]RRF96522.1 MAG: class I SAM-dependent RNA methyltransferase [Lachnospiraceae bacterium]